MVRITKNESYDEFGQWVKLSGVSGMIRPALPESRKMPDWWIEFGWEIQPHGGKLYYKGLEITEIDNFDPLKVSPATDPMTITWSLLMEDGSYTTYKPESWTLAKILFDSELWPENSCWREDRQQERQG